NLLQDRYVQPRWRFEGAKQARAGDGYENQRHCLPLRVPPAFPPNRALSVLRRFGERRQPSPARADDTEALLQARPGPRLELRVPLAALLLDGIGVLEPGIGFLDQQQLVQLAVRSQSHEAPPSVTPTFSDTESVGPRPDGAACLELTLAETAP